MKLHGLFHFGVAVLALCNTSPASTLRTVALTGHPAPGTAAGVFFSGIEDPPSLNNAGQTAFTGVVTGSGVTQQNRHGIWSEGSGSLALVAREGDPAVGVPDGMDYHFDGYYFPVPVINNAGQIAFFAEVIGSGVTNETRAGLWSEGSGQLSLVARTGGAVPGAPDGTVFSWLSGRFLNVWLLPALNNTGRVAFGAEMDGSRAGVPGSSGIWTDRSGQLTSIARAREAAPGISDDIGFRFSPVPPQPLWNSQSQTAFISELSGNGVSEANDVAIWSEGSGSLSLVAREGDVAPGLSDRFRDFSDLVLNNAGHVAFAATLHADGETPGTTLWSDRSGALELLAREGTPAPDTPDGVIFTRFRNIALNDADRIAFTGNLSGSNVNDANNSGIWLEGAEGFRLIAREGDRAPGTPDGVHFDQEWYLNHFAFNDTGQVAFYTRVTGTNIHQNRNDWGIWATDAAGNLRLVARTGDPLEVVPGDARTLDTIRVLGDHWFNDLGQIAFLASFTDGSQGVFVSNGVAVPEPAPLAMLPSGALFALCCFSRCRPFSSSGLQRPRLGARGALALAGLFALVPSVPHSAARAADHLFVVSVDRFADREWDPAAIWYLKTDGTGLTKIADDSGWIFSPRGIDYDPLNGHVYWSHHYDGIRRSDLSGANIETFFGHDEGASPKTDAHALAIDAVGRTLYWTSGGRILRADLDELATFETVTAVERESTYVSVALDNESQHLYWIEAANTCRPGCSGAIGRADLDGNNATTLLEELPQPGSIALDTQGRKMYWSSTVHRFLPLSADYDDSGHVGQSDLDLVLLHWGGSATPPSSGWINELPDGLIDQNELDNVLLNWGQSRTWDEEGVIYRANLDGSDLELLLAGFESPPAGLTIDAEARELYWTEDRYFYENAWHGTSAIRRMDLESTNIDDVLVMDNGLSFGAMALATLPDNAAFIDFGVIPEPASSALLVGCLSLCAAVTIRRNVRV